MYSDLTTLTYNIIELEHAQPNQHVVLLGVVDRRGRYSNTYTKPNINFVALVARVVPFQADQAVFVLTTTTTTDGQTDYFPLAAHARAG